MAPGTTAGYVLAVVVGVNSVIALFYYLRLTRYMFFESPIDGDVTPIRVPVSLTIALVLTVGMTLVWGVFPGRGDPLHRHGDLRARSVGGRPPARGGHPARAGR